MKYKFIAIFMGMLFFRLLSFAQIIGGFNVGQDGHIYFQAQNQTYYTYQITIVAESSDRNNSENLTLSPGGGFYLGPSTSWQWYWKKGDRISVVYTNGQSQTWICPQSDKEHTSSISFKGRHCNGSVGCSCPGFSPITKGKEWEKEYCKHCPHHKKLHK